MTVLLDKHIIQSNEQCDVQATDLQLSQVGGLT